MTGFLRFLYRDFSSHEASHLPVRGPHRYRPQFLTNRLVSLHVDVVLYRSALPSSASEIAKVSLTFAIALYDVHNNSTRFHPGDAVSFSMSRCRLLHLMESQLQGHPPTPKWLFFIDYPGLISAICDRNFRGAALYQANARDYARIVRPENVSSRMPRTRNLNYGPYSGRNYYSFP